METPLYANTYYLTEEESQAMHDLMAGVVLDRWKTYTGDYPTAYDVPEGERFTFVGHGQSGPVYQRFGEGVVCIASGMTQPYLKIVHAGQHTKMSRDWPLHFTACNKFVVPEPTSELALAGGE